MSQIKVMDHTDRNFQTGEFLRQTINIPDNAVIDIPGLYPTMFFRFAGYKFDPFICKNGDLGFTVSRDGDEDHFTDIFVRKDLTTHHL